MIHRKLQNMHVRVEIGDLPINRLCERNRHAREKALQGCSSRLSFFAQLRQEGFLGQPRTWVRSNGDAHGAPGPALGSFVALDRMNAGRLSIC